MNTPIEPVAWVERVENGNARMWSGDLSAWRDRPANPEPLYDQKTVDALIQSRDFYARRCEALQAIQGQMIAAAPELLTALKDLAQHMAWHLYGECRGLSDRLIGGPEAMDQAKAAIAKVTGMPAND